MADMLPLQFTRESVHLRVGGFSPLPCLSIGARPEAVASVAAMIRSEMGTIVLRGGPELDPYTRWTACVD